MTGSEKSRLGSDKRDVCLAVHKDVQTAWLFRCVCTRGMEMPGVSLAALQTRGNPSLLPLLISCSCEHKGWGVKSEILPLVCFVVGFEHS